MAERDNVRIANQFISSGGSASAPAYVFGDGDSGLYEDLDDNVSISTNGVQRLKISGADVFFLANGRSTLPGSADGGGYLFVSGGSLQYMGSSGTLTRLAIP